MFSAVSIQHTIEHGYFLLTATALTHPTRGKKPVTNSGKRLKRETSEVKQVFDGEIMRRNVCENYSQSF